MKLVNAFEMKLEAPKPGSATDTILDLINSNSVHHKGISTGQSDLKSNIMDPHKAYTMEEMVAMFKRLHDNIKFNPQYDPSVVADIYKKVKKNIPGMCKEFVKRIKAAEVNYKGKDIQAFIDHDWQEGHEWTNIKHLEDIFSDMVAPKIDPDKDGHVVAIKLPKLPGGSKTMELISKIDRYKKFTATPGEGKTVKREDGTEVSLAPKAPKSTHGENILAPDKWYSAHDLDVFFRAFRGIVELHADDDIAQVKKKGKADYGIKGDDVGQALEDARSDEASKIIKGRIEDMKEVKNLIPEVAKEYKRRLDAFMRPLPPALKEKIEKKYDVSWVNDLNSHVRNWQNMVFSEGEEKELENKIDVTLKKKETEKGEPKQKARIPVMFVKFERVGEI